MKRHCYKEGTWVYRINAHGSEEPHLVGQVESSEPVRLGKRGSSWRYRVRTAEGQLFEALHVPGADCDYRNSEYYVENLPGNGPLLR